jgi:SulP family sulfate permease
VRVVQVVIGDDGRAREIADKPALGDSAVTVLDIYGSLFFAAAPKVRAGLPPAATARRAVVVLRLRGRGALHSALLTLLGDYAAELAKGGGRLYLAGVGPETEGQLRRTHLIDMLGADAVVPATDEFYGACETAQRRGRQWLASAAAQSPEAHDVAATQAADRQDAAALRSPDEKVVAAPRSDR